MANAGNQEALMLQAATSYSILTQSELDIHERRQDIVVLAQFAGKVLENHELVVALPGKFYFDGEATAVNDPVEDLLEPNKSYPGVYFARASKPLRLEQPGSNTESDGSEESEAAYVAIADSPYQFRYRGNTAPRVELLDLSRYGVTIASALTTNPLPEIASFILPKNTEGPSQWDYDIRIGTRPPETRLEFDSLKHILNAIHEQSATRLAGLMGYTELPSVQFHPGGSPIETPIVYDLYRAGDRSLLEAHYNRDYDSGAY